jgi:glyoxylase-like metal-dependent hydrolase (beta-lactamase superfamily II)
MPSKKNAAKKKAKETKPKAAQLPLPEKSRMLAEYTLIIIIAILVIGSLVLFPLLKDFKPIGSGALAKDLFVYKQKMVNYYLVTDGKNHVLIDTGLHPEETIQQLKDSGIHPDKVNAVFLTHSDSDHAGGLIAFKKAKIYISQNEIPLTDGTAKRKILWMKRQNGLALKPSPLQDGQTVKIGKLRIKAISTPGHTPGSMSYLVNGKYLFIGDLAIVKDGKLVVSSKIFTMNPEQSVESLRKLATMKEKPELIATAHGGSTQDIPAAFAPYLNAP